MLSVFLLRICEHHPEFSNLTVISSVSVVAPDMFSAIQEHVSSRTISVEVISSQPVTIAPF